MKISLSIWQRYNAFVTEWRQLWNGKLETLKILLVLPAPGVDAGIPPLARHFVGRVHYPYLPDQRVSIWRLSVFCTQVERTSWPTRRHFLSQWRMWTSIYGLTIWDVPVRVTPVITWTWRVRAHSWLPLSSTVWIRCINVQCCIVCVNVACTVGVCTEDTDTWADAWNMIKHT